LGVNSWEGLGGGQKAEENENRLHH
jgi:hypothetical protein